MHSLVKGFFAYTSHLPPVVESVRNTITRINKASLMQVQGLESLSTTGKPILAEICRAIDESEVFICDF